MAGTSQLGTTKRILLLGIAIGAVLVPLRVRYQFALVSGESMLPTLRPGQLLLVDRSAYRHVSPQLGDIVLAHYGSDLIVKRIVGLPGEELELKHGVLYINGTQEVETHSVMPGLLDVARGKLWTGDYATLGDNRSVPAAVAVHPVLSKSDIVGKVIRKPQRKA